MYPFVLLSLEITNIKTTVEVEQIHMGAKYKMIEELIAQAVGKSVEQHPRCSIASTVVGSRYPIGVLVGKGKEYWVPVTSICILHVNSLVNGPKYVIFFSGLPLLQETYAQQ